MAPAVGLITAPLLARALGAEGRGELAAMLQPLTIASAIAVGGLPAAVTHFVGRGHGEKAVRLATIVAITSTLIVGAGLVVYSGLVSRNIGVSRTHLIVLWLAFIPSAVIAVRRARLQGQGIMRPLDAERALGAAFRLIAIVCLAVAGVGISFAYGFAYMGAGLLAMAPLIFARSIRGDVTPKSARDTFTPRGFMSFAGIASLGTIAAALNNRLDQALLPSVSSAVELGQYSAAVAVAEAPLVISIVVARNILAASSQGRSNPEVLKSAIFGGAVLSAICASIGLLAPWAVPFVFGAEFAPAVLPVVLLLGATMFQYVSECSNAYLIGSAKPVFASSNVGVGVVVLIGIYAVLGDGVTAVEAAWASVTVQAVCAFFAVTVIGILRIRQMRRVAV